MLEPLSENYMVWALTVNFALEAGAVVWRKNAISRRDARWKELLLYMDLVYNEQTYGTGGVCACAFLQSLHSYLFLGENISGSEPVHPKVDLIAR